MAPPPDTTGLNAGPMDVIDLTTSVYLSAGKYGAA